MKIAQIMPIYKGGDKENAVNICSPVFFKNTRKNYVIMYSRLYLYLTEKDSLYSKHFGFQKRHPTDHAIVQLADQIHDMFNKKKNYTRRFYSSV